MNLQDKAKMLPPTPGVYLMKDSFSNIIYVGKAKKLKQRVHSYFQDSKYHSKKVKRMIQNIDSFEVIHTDTEFEAFLLECDLIKKLKPFFNIRMKNPQNYPYIVLIKEKGISKFKITNNPNQYEDCSIHIFGPYSSKNTVEKAMNVIKNGYKINCGNLTNRNTLCTNYSLGLCLGVCRGDSDSELIQYEQQIDQIILLLNGTDKRFIKELREKMLRASGLFDFETAAKYKDEINALQALLRKKKVISFAEKQKNIAVIEQLNESQIKFFLVKGNKILFKEKYNLSMDTEGLRQQIQSAIISVLKGRKRSSLTRLQQNEVDEAQIIFHYIKGSKDHIVIPQTWIDSGNHIKLTQALKCFDFNPTD